MPQEPLSRLESLVPRLLLNLAILMLLGAAAVATITRSLERLARAAERVGAEPEGAPLPEVGPSEVRSVIRAFNRMRLQLRSYLLERARMLGAISHDLQTPITRLRLRAEMIQDPASRAKFVRDLDEMEAMPDPTLEFFKTLGNEPQRQPLDVGALLGSLAEDWSETRSRRDRARRARGPYLSHPQALRRCLDNLVENALRYGRARADRRSRTTRRRCASRCATTGRAFRRRSSSASSSRSSAWSNRATGTAGDRARPRHRAQHRPLARRRHPSAQRAGGKGADRGAGPAALPVEARVLTRARARQNDRGSPSTCSAT